MKRISVVVLGILTSTCVYAQGTWRADTVTEHPRTLFTSDDLNAVRARVLNDEPAVFASLSATAFETREANSSWDDRRARARIAKAAAFLVAVDAGVVNGAAVGSLPDGVRDELRAKAMAYLESTNLDLPSVLTASSDFQFLSAVVTQSVQAYDLLAGVTEDDLASAAARLQQLVAGWFGEANRFGGSYWSLTANNLSLRTAGSFALAGLVLNDLESSDPDAQPATWISTGTAEIERALFQRTNRQSDLDGAFVYGEGPWYFQYAMQTVLPYWRAQRQALAGMSPVQNYDGLELGLALDDPRVDALFDWSISLRLPNGQLPPVGDTFDKVFFPMERLAGRSTESWTSYGSVGTDVTAALKRGVYDARADWLAATDAEVRLPEPGLADVKSGYVFRSAGEDALYAYIHAPSKAENGAAGGHNQADATSFVLYAGAQPLMIDPGYIQFRDRGAVAGPQSHSMLLVNGAGPTVGEPGNGGGVPVDGQVSVDLLCARCTGRLMGVDVKTSYKESEIARSFLMVPGSDTQSAYLVVRDNVTSSEAGGAVFTLQAHGNGEESAGTMRLDAANQVAVYAAGEVGLEVGLNEVDGSGRLQSRQATRETAFAQAGPYTVTELVTARQAEAAFGSVYVPRVPGRSAQVNVEQGWFEVGTDLVFNSAATNVIGGWTAEARQAVVRRAGEDWQLIALVGGQSIRRLDRPVVSVGGTDEALNVLIERVGASELSIRAQAEATLVVHDVPAPSAVQNAPDLQYEASDRTLRFSVAPGLQTRLSFPQPISSEHGTPESIRPRAFPNPTSGRLTVEAGTDRQPTEFEVYDLLGRLVRSGTFTRSTTLDTSGWPAGHYFVALKTGTHREVIAITALR